MQSVILAIRYLFKRRISYFSVFATALCVFVVLVVITVISGLVADFKKNTHQSVGDCVISTKSLVGFGYYQEFMDRLSKAEFVHAASPVVRSYALINIKTDTAHLRGYVSETAEIMGIDPIAHSSVTGFAQWLHYNKDNPASAFKPGYNPEQIGCVPGMDFLFKRDSYGNYNITEKLPEIGFEISSLPLTAKGSLARAGAGAAATKTFYFSDTAQSGLARIDSSRIYLPLEQAQILCGMAGPVKRISAIHIKFKPDVPLKEGCEKIASMWQKFVQEKSGQSQANLFEKVTVQNWKLHGRMIIAAVENEQTMMTAIFGIIGIITVFIVFVVFYMIVSHKLKDIGILKSIGASNTSVMIQFLTFASLVGLCGSALGALAGWQFLVHINQIENWLFERFNFQLWDRTIYAIGDIPNTIDLKVLSCIILSAIIACLAGALIPSWQAAKSEPIETLQVNQL